MVVDARSTPVSEMNTINGPSSPLGLSGAPCSCDCIRCAAKARNIADQAYSTLIACLVDKPTCQSADVMKMTAALAEPVRLGQGPGGLVIASQSADGKISRENYMITAYTSAKMALPDAPPDVISYTVMAQGSEDVRRCGPFYADQCVKGADGYGAWPKS